ncbi:MAG: hypothetical protein Q9227_008661 [Pyrenula ochraceoflavens]
MATQTEPEIILYDLSCIPNVCFSPAVWRIRLMLNYKKIPYKTVFIEFPDIEPKLKELRLLSPPTSAEQASLLTKPPSDIHPPSGSNKYTVPAIHHLPTNTKMMDSTPIAQFLESTYPTPPVPLTSDLGSRIELQSRTTLAPAFRASITPRELPLLTPRAQSYFRRTREADLPAGYKLEDLLKEEEQAWEAVDEGMKGVGELIRTNRAEGPFVLGKGPSATDFFVVGNMEAARVIEESVFKRLVGMPGFGEVYEACRPWLERTSY